MTGTFVYDGDCSFCTMCVRFAERHVPTPARLVPWQWADLGALGLTRAECVESVRWVPGDGGPPAAGPVAISRLLRTGTAPWRLAGRLLGLRPVLVLAWPAYRWVARNRHRLPGGTAACAVPPTSGAESA